MMSDHVTHAEFNSQLILIHQTMHDNQKDGYAQLHRISTDVSRIAVSVEKLQAQQNTRLDQHDKDITNLTVLVSANNEHRIKASTWMIMVGVVATAGLGAVVKFVA